MNASAKHSLIYISIFIAGLFVVDYLLESSSWNYWIGFTLGAVAQSFKSSLVEQEKRLVEN